MGECQYCHKDAGWFKSKHSECEETYKSGLCQIESILKNSFNQREDFFLHKNEIDKIAKESFINKVNLDTLYIESLDKAVKNFLNDGIIDKYEEKIIARFIQFTQLPQATLNKTHALDKVVQSRIIEDILRGNPIKPAITVSGNFPFILSKNETLIWLYRNVILHEQKIKKEYIGRSNGLNIRIARGVYYRIGGFKGSPVETSYMKTIGTGCVCLTDKNLYFSAPEKSIKISYSHILSIESYSNGTLIQKDGRNNNCIFLEGVDSWFLHNVISNLK